MLNIFFFELTYVPFPNLNLPLFSCFFDCGGLSWDAIWFKSSSNKKWNGAAKFSSSDYLQKVNKIYSPLIGWMEICLTNYWSFRKENVNKFQRINKVLILLYSTFIKHNYGNVTVPSRWKLTCLIRSCFHFCVSSFINHWHLCFTIFFSFRFVIFAKNLENIYCQTHQVLCCMAKFLLQDLNSFNHVVVMW